MAAVAGSALVGAGWLSASGSERGPAGSGGCPVGEAPTDSRDWERTDPRQVSELIALGCGKVSDGRPFELVARKFPGRGGCLDLYFPRRHAALECAAGPNPRATGVHVSSLALAGPARRLGGNVIVGTAPKSAVRVRVRFRARGRSRTLQAALVRVRDDSLLRRIDAAKGFGVFAFVPPRSFESARLEAFARDGSSLGSAGLPPALRRQDDSHPGQGEGVARPATREARGGAAPLPVGTVIPKGEGKPPRDSTSTVVATGTAPVTGPWQLEVWRGHGGNAPTAEPPGRCLFIHPLAPPHLTPSFSGFCGGLGFRKTPGFSRAQLNVPPPRKRPGGSLSQAKEVLIYGRVPERAAAIVITASRGVRIEITPGEGPKTIPGDFFVIPVKPGLGRARINWTDRDGNPGSRGIALMPPVTDS